MKLYGNEHALAALEAMCTSGRLPHSFLIYGEQGTGKKTLAWYLAARLLCEGAQKPCGSCKPCHNLEHRQHPDVMEIPHSGKTGGFSVESIRRVCADAYKTPNNGMRKLYLFTDADHMTVQAQNALLKLVEEPPDFTYFVFTAQSRHAFLETILSRVSAIGTSPCTDAQCTQALLSAVPIPDPEVKKERIILQGSIPSPLNAPKGCKFNTRCQKCMDICKEIPPEKKQMDENHYVYCHLYDKE